VKLSFARAEVAALVPALDADRDGHVSAAEVSAGRDRLEEKVLGKIDVRGGGAPCTATLLDAALTEQDGLFVQGRFDCASAAGGFAVDAAILDELARGHRHVARAVSGEVTHDEVLYGDHRSFTVPAAKAAPAARADGATEPPPSGTRRRAGGAVGFFRMGVEHILTGYDHLVFLLGLVLARGRLRSLLAVVTAFTVAHSITLALAAFGVWAPSARIVEPAIALSIVYVGVENFFVKDVKDRWRITFPFGLIHGFGFAGALQEIALPRAEIPVALVSFNLGVEAGQLAVMAAVLPLLVALRKREWFETRAVRFVSGAVAVAGGIWFVSRAFGG
jgi:hydrogenase/urease accessory protein HupE